MGFTGAHNPQDHGVDSTRPRDPVVLARPKQAEEATEQRVHVQCNFQSSDLQIINTLKPNFFDKNIPHAFKVRKE